MIIRAILRINDIVPLPAWLLARIMGRKPYLKEAEQTILFNREFKPWNCVYAMGFSPAGLPDEMTPWFCVLSDEYQECTAGCVKREDREPIVRGEKP